MGQKGLPLPPHCHEWRPAGRRKTNARFRSMPSIIEKRYTDETRRRIKTYVHNRRETTEALLGKGAVYFPIIEQYLKEHGLPLELRVLPIIETNFDPLAVSHAGATGLWQLMEGTAELYGLTMSKGMDQRLDIHRSTEAAVLLLARLYEKYGDWGLALAAYNCGPRPVNRALKRSKKKDYWSIARQLPRETQRYVPRFLAASYLVNYYHEHDLMPAFPELDLQLTRDVRLPVGLCFEELAVLANTPVEVLRKLNPAYKGDCLPHGPQGVVVTLPKRCAEFVPGFLAMPVEGRALFPELCGGESGIRHAASEYDLQRYVPSAGESLSDVADRFRVEESLLGLWNGLEPQPQFDGQRELIIYTPRVRRFHLPKVEVNYLSPDRGRKPASMYGETSAVLHLDQLMAGALAPQDYLLHTLGFGETFGEVSRLYRLDSEEVIREHNPKVLGTAGEILRIPRSSVEMAVK
jgi:membrane-bound lytic murein transglycosylase D